MTYNLKLTYAQTTRRVTLTPNSEHVGLGLKDLTGKALQLFAPNNLQGDVAFTFVDEDGDVVAVNSQEELDEAIRIQRSHTPGLPLKFNCVGAESPQDAPPVPPPLPKTGADPAVPAAAPVPVHEHVVCDGCGVTPIRGDRFKCTVRDDYDLCPACERTRNEPFPLRKISEPQVFSRANWGPKRAGGSGCRPHGPPRCGPKWLNGMPAWSGWGGRVNRHARRLADNFRRHGERSQHPWRDICNLALDFIEDEHQSATSRTSAGGGGAAAAGGAAGGGAAGAGAGAGAGEMDDDYEEVEMSLDIKPSRPMSRFVRDLTYRDGTEVPTGRQVDKMWVVRNDGPVAWPEGTTLQFSGGDQLDHVVNDVVLAEPGQEVELSATVIAPEAEGRFTTYFRLVDENGRMFGQRFWVDIRVVPEAAEASENSGTSTDSAGAI